MAARASRSVNAQQEAVALWQFLEGRGLRPTMSSVARCLRDHGVGFRNQDLREWLDNFAWAHRRPKSSEPSVSPVSTKGEPGVSPGRTRGEPSRARDKVSLVSNYSLPSVESTAKMPRTRQPRLDTRTEAEQVADSAFSALRPDIEPSLVSGTWNGWRKRNRQATVEMARAGMTAEEIAEAACQWRAVKDRQNVVMAWVAEWVQGGRQGAQKPRNDPKNGCECDLDVGDCLRLHTDDGSPQPLIEIIEKQRAAGVYTGSIAQPAVPGIAVQ